jgi:hypothetical protein
MDTYSLADKNGTGRPFAFEIENVYLAPRHVGQILGGVAGVDSVKIRRPFTSFKEIHVAFKYLDRDYIVWEPYGDNSRYWIGPKNTSDAADDITPLEDAFKRYQPARVRRVIGDILSLRLLRRMFRRSDG